MKTIRILTLAVCMVLTCSSAVAQVKAGNEISGKVYGEDGPIADLIIVVMDSVNHIVAHPTTDSKGRFSFNLPSAKCNILVSYMDYETVVVPADRSRIRIRLKKRTIGFSNVIGYQVFESGSKGMEWLNKNAPEEYVCGYEMVSPWGSFIYSLFLVKEENNFSLVYKESDATETRNIDSRLAHDLELSVITKTAYEKPSKSRSNEELENLATTDDEVTILYDGLTAYAVSPGKAVSIWPDNFSKDLPDEKWQAELEKFRKQQ